MMIKLALLIPLLIWHGNSPSGKALTFAGIYAVFTLGLSLAGVVAGGDLMTVVVVTVVRFAAAWLLFWLLDRFHGLFGWILAIVGTLALAVSL